MVVVEGTVVIGETVVVVVDGTVVVVSTATTTVVVGGVAADAHQLKESVPSSTPPASTMSNLKMVVDTTWKRLSRRRG